MATSMLLSSLKALHAPRRALSRLGRLSTEQQAIRSIATSAEQLLPLQESIGIALRSRLSGLPEAPSQPRIAVVGPHVPIFAAALRAVGTSDGAVVAPVDSTSCDREALMERVAEVQAHLVVVAGASQETEASVQDVTQRLGSSWVSALTLCTEGMEVSADVSVGANKSSSQATSPMLFFSTPPGGTTMRAAHVPQPALTSRVDAAIQRWGYSKEDTVLSLALSSESTVAVVDAIEAPLHAGSTVALPEWRSHHLREWDLWAAMRDEPDTTVLFISAEWCQKLVSSYGQLAAGLRSELEERWSSRPLRHIVAVADSDVVPCYHLAERWLSIFKCPLSWQYSSAETGSLYVVTPEVGQSSTSSNKSMSDVEVNVVDGEVFARGSGLFDGYHERPKSSGEAFDGDGFWNTGHWAAKDEASGSLIPQMPWKRDWGLERETNRHLVEGPRWEKLGMAYCWHVKKVKMKKYFYWTPKKQYKIITKKGTWNARWLRYTPRYKRNQGKYRRVERKWLR